MIATIMKGKYTKVVFVDEEDGASHFPVVVLLV
jgi:hypothetical protein